MGLCVRGIVAAALLGWLAFGPTLACAQPEAMPITLLDNGDSSVVHAYATEPVARTQFEAQSQPQPIAVVDTPSPFDDPPPTIGPVVQAPGVPNARFPQPEDWAAPWTWQVLPDGLLYKNYLAGLEEARLGSQLYHDKNVGWTWDASLGAHVGILRFGSQDPAWADGLQLDVDGVALPRLDSSRSIMSVDFRIGFPLTYREGPWEFKFGYYHLSSHLGDLYIESHPDAVRLNYVREQIVLGVAYRPLPDLRFYAEANWAWVVEGGAQPWEFQFGIDFSPSQPNGIYGGPFAAINSKVFQDLNYSGNVNFEAGWQWRGVTGHTLRTGVDYFDGFSFQRQFYNVYQQFIGAGVWYDF
jgi:hypothetical protein